MYWTPKRHKHSSKARLQDGLIKKVTFRLTNDKVSLKLAIVFLVNGCFLNSVNLSFRRIIGISKGLDPAPFMTNLFLCYYENKWLLDTKKRDLKKARVQSNLFPFTDVS